MAVLQYFFRTSYLSSIRRKPFSTYTEPPHLAWQRVSWVTQKKCIIFHIFPYLVSPRSPGNPWESAPLYLVIFTVIVPVIVSVFTNFFFLTYIFSYLSLLTCERVVLKTKVPSPRPVSLRDRLPKAFFGSSCFFSL